MYLRTIDQAKDAMADLLGLPDRREQLVRSTVQIMLCLDLEPRDFLLDCQALFIQDGLEALRRKRRDAHMPPFNDPGSAALLESVARAMDALRFADLARQILPGLREERWRVARVLLVNEAGVRACLERALQGRGDVAALSAAESLLHEMILSLHQPWMDRLGAIRSACLEVVRAAGTEDPDLLHPESEFLFELFATSDERANALLYDLDRAPSSAARRVAYVHELAAAIRSFMTDSPHRPPGVRDVA